MPVLDNPRPTPRKARLQTLRSLPTDQQRVNELLMSPEIRTIVARARVSAFVAAAVCELAGLGAQNRFAGGTR